MHSRIATTSCFLCIYYYKIQKIVSYFPFRPRYLKNASLDSAHFFFKRSKFHAYRIHCFWWMYSASGILSHRKILKPLMGLHRCHTAETQLQMVFLECFMFMRSFKFTLANRIIAATSPLYVCLSICPCTSFNLPTTKTKAIKFSCYSVHHMITCYIIQGGL